jgi:hypothetical protein
MAQARNTFLSSRMNRDKDARLVPNGEYREGRNININKSEGADVGALENLLGNESIVQDAMAVLQSNVTSNQILEIIGLFTDKQTSSLYLFLTTFSDGSATQLANNGVDFDCKNYICRVHLSEGEYVFTVLVEGRFLNFSKTHVISGFNVVENLIFWTDNRNQPRRINLDSAMAQPGDSASPYYYSEDQISVAKYAPIDPILLIKNTGTEWEGSNAIWEPTTNSEANEYLPIHVTAPYNSSDNTNPEWRIDFSANPALTPKWTGVAPATPGTDANTGLAQYIVKGSSNNYPVVRAINLTQPNTGSFLVNDSTGNINYVVPAVGNDVTAPALVATHPNPALSWTQGDLIGFQLKNPAYNASASYDKEFLKDKFVRFSYRFKYLNNEYSLMAPFTQSVFVPGQFGSITHGDEDSAANSTELQFFENLATSAGLNIVLPQVEIAKLTTTDDSGNRQVATDTATRYEIKELEILLKLSNDNNVYSIDSIPLSGMNDNLVNKTNSAAAYTTKYPLYAQLEYEYKATKPFQVLPERDVIRVNDATPVRALGQEVAGNRVMYGNYLNSHAAPLSLPYQCEVSAKKGSISDYNIADNPPISSKYNNTIKEYYNNTLKQGRTYQVGIVLADRYGRQSNVILAENTSQGGDSSYTNSTIYAPYSNQGTLTDLLTWFGNSIKVIFNGTIPSETNQDYYPGLYSDSNPLGWYSYKVVVKQNEQEYYNVYLPGALSGSVIYLNNTTDIDFDNIYSTSNLSLFGDNINKIPKDVTNVGPTDKIYGSKSALYYRVYQYSYSANNKNNNFQFEDPIPYSVNTIQPFLDFGPWAKDKGSTSANAYPSTATDFIDPLYNADKNPFVATIDHSQSLGTRIGFSKAEQETAPPKFSTSLMVAETKPVISNLDIFWETTTTGLISDLNEAVVSSPSLGQPKDLSTWKFSWEEQYDYDGSGTPGDFLLQSDITIITYPTNAVTSDNNYRIRLDSVVSKIGPVSYDMRNYFTLHKNSSTTPHTYNIKLEDPSQYWNSNEFHNKWNGEFIFTFVLTTHDLTTGEAFPPITIVKDQNYLTNNDPIWTTAYNPASSEVDFITPTSNSKIWTFSLQGKEEPRKSMPLFKRDTGIGGLQSGWQPNATAATNANNYWLQGKINDSTPVVESWRPLWVYEGSLGVSHLSPDFSNGSFVKNSSATEMFIKKLEFQTYNSDGSVNTAWQEYTIDETLLFENRNSTAAQALSAWPFYNWMVQYPFQVKYKDNYAYIQLNANHPPIVPIDHYKDPWDSASGGLFNSDYLLQPDGDLANNQFCLYKISLAVKETFPANTSLQRETNPTDKVMYVRLNR